MGRIAIPAVFSVVTKLHRGVKDVAVALPQSDWQRKDDVKAISARPSSATNTDY